MKNYTRSEKPALRQDGELRYDVTVTHPAGLDEIAYVIHQDFENDPRPLGRKVIFDALAKLMRSTGGLPLDAWDEIAEEEVLAATKLAERWFPELKRPPRSA
jgi:hypothetical protein